MADEWITPNYTFVDIIEYEMELEKRRRIEDFCIQFFIDWETATATASSTKLLVYTCQQIINEKKLHTITKDVSIHLTMNNFDASFQIMCMELFKSDSSSITKDEYVVSLLAFCIELNTCLQQEEDEDHAWYTPRLLITSLIDALEDVDFNPLTFNWGQSETDLMIDSIATSFIIIIIPLLFFYILFR